MVLIAAGMLVAVVAVGFGLDYGRAMVLQAKLAEAGHAAAMAAVSPAMMAQDQASTTSAASGLFAGQVTGLPGLVFDAAAGLQVDVSDGAAASGAGGRQAMVRWSAAYASLFGGVFGASSLPITGSAVAMAQGAANVSFTLLMVPASKELALAGQALAPVVLKQAAQNGVVYEVRWATATPVPGGGAIGGYAAAISAVDASLPAPGDGATPASAQGVVLLASDGSPGEVTGDDLAACAAIRARGIVLAVLYAPGAGGFAGSAVIANGLRACASPQMGGAALFVQQAPGQSPSEALAALFALAVANARLVH